MNLQELEDLLERYYDGNCSSPDQKRLTELLYDKDLPPEYLADKQMIEGLSEYESIPEPDDGFESRIMAAIDESEKEMKLSGLRRKVYIITSVAAAILIMISSYFLLVADQQKDTFSDPLLAYNQTKQILYRVSAGINSGKEHLYELSAINEVRSNISIISNSQNTLNKELDPLKHLNKSIRLFDISSSNN